MLIPKEIWKDIEGYENYQVSNMGRVRSLNYRHTGEKHRLKPSKNECDYLQVVLCENGKRKTHKVHRLVATAFIPNPNNYPCVNHKNENKQNNEVSNLEWCTYEYNNNYGTKNKRVSEAHLGRTLSEETKQKISEAKLGKYVGEKNPMYGRTGEKNPRARAIVCVTTGEVFACITDAKHILGISQSNICNCCSGKRKSAGKTLSGEPRVWRYLDEE